MGVKGAALIFVLVVVALLSLLVLELAFLVRVEGRLLAYWEDDRSAYYMGKGGVNLARHFVWIDSPLVDSLNDEWAQSFPPFTVRGSSVEFSVSDEDGKINVNRMMDENGDTGPVYGVLRRLLELSDKDPALADDILSHLREAGNGRESSAGTFMTREELLKFPELEDVISCLTVYTDGRINLNTAPVLVIQSMSGRIDRALAEEIVLARETAPFGSVSQLARVSGVDSRVMRDIRRLGKVRSSVFRITAESSSGNVSRSTVAVIERGRGGTSIIYFRSV